MKKVISCLLLVAIIFNFICSSNVYAEQGGVSPDDSEVSSPYEEPAVPSDGIAGEIVEEGTTSQKQDGGTKVATTALSYGASIVGVVTGVVARLLNIFIAAQVDIIISHLTYGTEDGELQYWFTIDRCVFNRIPLFNINYFNTDSTYQVGNTTIDANASNIKIKEGITGVYYICRILALAIGLLVLIYIGIRMAISTIASEQAKYKKMLVSWVESIVIMFLMLYIISAVVTFGEIITGIFYDIRCSILGKTAPGVTATFGIFEETIRDEAWCGILSKSGLDLTLWSIIYWCLLFTELKFLWTYMKRLLMVGFLIIISPLITITYSIDKVGDGKAQAFSIWLKEFIVNVLIQPLHALIYLIFVMTANSIAASSPLVAIAMLMAMGSVERMVKVVFDMKGLVTLSGVNKFMKKEG